MKISQKMIAELAGVSRGTVDRVLHGKPNVKPETRKKVISAIERLEYSPNMAGRALALSHREYCICAVLPDNPFFDDVRDGMRAALSELSDYNISLECIITNGKSNSELISEISSIDCHALMVAMGDSEDIRRCIKDKADAGVPVITFNTDVRDCGRLCFVGQDLYKSGRIAASLMVRMLRDDGGRVLIVTGNSKYKAHRERVEGFADVVRNSAVRIEIADVIETDDDCALTYERVTAALKADRDIDGIYVASANIVAFERVIEELGGRYRVVVNDLHPAIERALRNGSFDFTIFQNPFEQGYRPVKLLFECLFNGAVPQKEFYYTDNTVITGEML